MTDIGGDRFGPWDTHESTYAWLIHKDYLARPGERDDKGQMGPRNAPQALIERLLAGEGRKFKMYDDDGELYYDGKIVGVDDSDEIFLAGSVGGDVADFGPLWDFGTPNAGCTEIRYKNEEGQWQTL